ncbi:hypothetical protein HOLleu_11134 [Holothuria leucospilota]|uniref:Uncharacterized protein n=1 Tax=Holothuria leucospilota TaxID=206669 RepID=A0A9Q1CEV9_HOLLE|nr:hypothetical protein HOLleu_11134 [Holothuria leucospilota]
MREAGINTAQFKPHSTRAEAVSKAHSAPVPITDITAGGLEYREYFQKILQQDLVKTLYICLC